LAKANGNLLLFLSRMKWLEKYRRKRLLIRARQINRNVILCSSEQVKKVGIVWHENDREAFRFLRDYFKEKGAIVRHICFSTDKSSSGNHIITKKQTNWLGFPVGGTFEAFISSDFDLLFNITTQPCFPLEAVTALSAASFKIGWDFNQSGFYDLAVDVSARPDSLYLAQQQIFYLQTINQKK